MNCDQVFDVLTRGPFPGGDANDAQVDLHLGACHECRQLAEALRPAAHMLREVGTNDAAGGLPGYRGDLEERPVVSLPAAIDAMIADQITEPERRVRGWRRVRRLPHVRGQLAAAALIALAVGVALWQTALGEHLRSLGGGLVPRTGVAGRPFPADDGGSLLLALLGLPAACRDNVASGDSPQTGDELTAIAPVASRAAGFRCCTECHTASAAQRPPVTALAMVASSCQLCHE